MTILLLLALVFVITSPIKLSIHFQVSRNTYISMYVGCTVGKADIVLTSTVGCLFILASIEEC